MNTTKRQKDLAKAKARQLHRSQIAEDLLDVFLEKLTERIRSERCRAQDLIAASHFLKRNGFQVKPTSVTEDGLDVVLREIKLREKTERQKQRNIDRAKAQNEQRAEQFRQKQNG
jgi:hypothetical protein